jgi:hypothetical protein
MAEAVLRHKNAWYHLVSTARRLLSPSRRPVCRAGGDFRRHLGDCPEAPGANQ